MSRAEDKVDPRIKEVAEIEAVAPRMSLVRFRHLRTGNVYLVVGFCLTENPVRAAVLYRPLGAGHDFIPWCRPLAEFLDGRFVREPGAGWWQ